MLINDLGHMCLTALVRLLIFELRSAFNCVMLLFCKVVRRSDLNTFLYKQFFKNCSYLLKKHFFDFATKTQVLSQHQYGKLFDFTKPSFF